MTADGRRAAPGVAGGSGVECRRRAARTGGPSWQWRWKCCYGFAWRAGSVGGVLVLAAFC